MSFSRKSFKTLSFFIICFFLVLENVYGLNGSCVEHLKSGIDKPVLGCPFCEAFKVDLENVLKPSHFDKTVIVYSRYQNFFLKVQRGGFLEGSVLIASRRHNLTRISDMNNEEFEEFFEFYIVISRHIKESFGIEHLIAFENGTVGSNTTIEANENDKKGFCRPDGGGCLSHFHWHINPLESKINLNKVPFEIPAEAKKVSSWQHFKSFMKKNPGKLYTLIEYQEELYFIDRSVHKRRSEWMRLLIALHLKTEGLYKMEHSYSWRKQPNDDISIETLKKLRRRYGFEHMPILYEE